MGQILALHSGSSRKSIIFRMSGFMGTKVCKQFSKKLMTGVIFYILYMEMF